VNAFRYLVRHLTQSGSASPLYTRGWLHTHTNSPPTGNVFPVHTGLALASEANFPASPVHAGLAPKQEDNRKNGANIPCTRGDGS
jgi:hypothetical protein